MNNQNYKLPKTDLNRFTELYKSLGISFDITKDHKEIFMNFPFGYECYCIIFDLDGSFINHFCYLDT